jgi:hypothetical protein
MKNIVTASIHFSFKGKRHSPAITIELDKHLLSTGKFPNLYPLIAKANNFDMYSYEYEMMQAEPIKFSDAQGLVENYIVDGQLNLDAFESAWHENKTLEKLLQIAEQHLEINDFSQHPDLKAALLEAYNAGKRNVNTS